MGHMLIPLPRKSVMYRPSPDVRAVERRRASAFFAWISRPAVLFFRVFFFSDVDADTSLDPRRSAPDPLARRRRLEPSRDSAPVTVERRRIIGRRRPLAKDPLLSLDLLLANNPLLSEDGLLDSSGFFASSLGCLPWSASCLRSLMITGSAICRAPCHETRTANWCSRYGRRSGGSFAEKQSARVGTGLGGALRSGPAALPLGCFSDPSVMSGRGVGSRDLGVSSPPSLTPSSPSVLGSFEGCGGRDSMSTPNANLHRLSVSAPVSSDSGRS
mmetsp:Transcript_23494/g.73688  ORF Transcript_23494/g.73688 Transcript_23494/m.73688 type:complete len:272 (-) Transcript_23494:794-1609(-)